jgi:mannose-6-phosphate isomerase
VPTTNVTRVEKPWGYELIWARTGRYVGKILHINAGAALSYQYHRVKEETIHVLSGALTLHVSDDDAPPRVIELRQGESFHITPGLRHRFEAKAAVDLLEASTPELDDVVRLEDRYGRAGT